MLSVAFALTVVTPAQRAPAAGAVIETVGGVVSAVTDGARLVGDRADVARGVLGGDLVVVGAGREPVSV